tara:strand:+ start:283 stop:492 length:210 start_codon:yes stop_codon:yes gene_type:complete
MNIWVEYWKKPSNKSLNNHAQMRENAKWINPDPKEIRKRFCQSREDASLFANSMQNQGYFVSIKTDGVV